MIGAAARASFHDPDGSVYLGEDRVLRLLTRAAGQRLLKFLRTPLAARMVTEGRLPQTRALAADEAPELPRDGDMMAFEHARLPFLNYPHEWLPAQLAAAGEATLDIAAEARAIGWDLKDGNARNIIFRGGQPVFVDFGSFVQRDDSTPVWRPAGQLQRHVHLPLLLYQLRSLAPSSTLLARPEGITHAEAYAALRGARFSNRHVFWLCALPAWLGRQRASGKAKSRSFTPEVARAAVDATVRSNRRRLTAIARQLEPAGASVDGEASHWAGYEASRHHYTTDQVARKRSVVEGMLRAIGPGMLLDIGANGGEFSNMAARLGFDTVSIDNDVDALAIARRAAIDAGLDVLHLLVDLAAPTPATGWNGAECQSFDARATGRFDAVMALAVMHHVMVAGGIPLAELLAKLAAYTRRELIIEYVDPCDPMFAEIARQRGRDFSALDPSSFEAALTTHFTIEEHVEIIEGRRSMYRCKRRTT